MIPLVDPIICAKALTHTYTRGRIHTPVLRGVDLEVPEGAFAVLVGPSGCGKSTLLNLVGGLAAVEGGSLTVGGAALHGCSPSDRMRFRRDVVAFIFQYYLLIPELTALENVAVVLEPLGLSARQIRDRAVPLLEAVGLPDKADRFPGELSGGEQQRVAIARALAKQPRVVLADEPTGSLDQAHSTRIVALMKAQQQQTGATFFVVTHDPAVVAAGTHVFEMRDGQVRPQ